jgi:hypothetical protein
MTPDTLVVYTKSLGGGYDLTPLFTGFLGGIIGIAGTFIASRNARKIAVDQIHAQKAIAKEQLREQGDATDKQLRVAVLAGNRVRWIEQLRTEIAAFSAGCMAVVTDLSAEADKAIFNPKIDKVNEHVALVSVLLNQEEPDSIALESALNATTSLFGNIGDVKFGRTEIDKVEAHIKEVAVIARRILKTEWIRVKNLE